MGVFRKVRGKFATYHFLLIALLALGGCVHTESPAKPAVAPAPGPLKKPFLWTATKDGRTSVLLGTIHVGVDARKDLPKAVWDEFDKSPCFVMEADESQVSPQQLMGMAMLPEGQTLPKQLKPDVWAKVKAKLGKQMPEDLLQRTRPWFAALLYLQTLTPKGDPMDGALLAAAKQQSKRVEYLEDWREAIGAFSRVTTAADLEDLALHEDEAARQTKALLAAYRTGDEAELTRVTDEINRDTLNADEKLKVLLHERNERWVPRLEQSLAKGACFVAVGAGHLVGDANLRALLAKRGWKIERAAR